MTLQRLEAWPTRLTQFLAAREKAPFAWHGNDCCTFAADAVIAVTGQDVLAAERALYDDAGSALRLMAAQGGLLAMAHAKLGEPLLYPLRALRGDVGLLPPEAGVGRWPVLAVCEGLLWRAPSRNGLERFAYHLATVAWGIGHG